ncbi:glycosyl hydrolase [Luteolibacter sp. GHJ8]|uniref:Glycosyl hydrolase n=1 Tax=Luteolibacter rhizosphaerae TaxID=2989719 RepID=A0ABT3GA42_9BACT|nr:LamG-like jellyroll fold domain-containing protein [Luteolibacter rhizosphaerae]MCW1916665.1 glycosyl hydrolase [Luteolibacter rhizosphaerae]
MGLLHCVLILLCLLTLFARGQTLVLNNEVHRADTLAANTVATLSGKSELHINGGGDPIPGCTIHLNSENSFLFLHQLLPSSVAATYLSRVRVNGAAAVLDTNVRVVEHVAGTVLIPQPSSYLPLQVFTGTHLTGTSKKLGSYTAYNTTTLGPFADNIRSFILKRGYTATFAQNENGTGSSVNYVAQDGDLEVSFMPAALDRTVSFIRVFPWRWTGKKGSCDVGPVSLKANWNYNWNISSNSTLDWEYVAIKQQPNWPGLDQDWKWRGVNHLSGYNEPDNSVEDAYQNLTPAGSAVNAAARWPDLLSTGLRVGAPAVTDGGTGWLNTFMNEANSLGHRVDYVPVHYYRSYWNKTDPAGAATQMYNFLKSIYDATGKPVWVTEFNNGANWTDNAHDPDVTQNRNAIEAMINMMDNTPWIERYAIYSRVEWFRQTHYDDGSITPMGAMYRDHVAPIAYQQVVPNNSPSAAADYLFDGNVRDSRNGNNPVVYGSPTMVPGKHGTALSFDGTDDFLRLPNRLGDSTDFSSAAWVKWGGGANWQRIFDFGTGTNAYLFLSPKAGSNVLRFTIKNGGAEQQLNHSAALPVNVWTHVAVTLTGNTGKLFVNGALVATNTAMDINPDAIGTNSNFIGDSQFAADPMFNGQLDDLRFYTNALSDAQVATLAASTPAQFSADLLNKPSAPKYQPYVASIAADLSGGSVTFSKLGGPAWLAVAPDGSLTGVPGLNDGGINTFLVSATTPAGTVQTATVQVEVTEAAGLSSRYAFNGTPLSLTGPAHGIASGSPAYVAGTRGQAIDLDGTDDLVTLPAGVASHDEITIATWVNWDGGGNWQRIFDFGNGTEEYFFLCPKSASNRMLLLIRRNGVETSVDAGPLATGQWVHLAATLGGGNLRLFVNGSQVSTTATTMKLSDINPAMNYIGDSQYAADPLFNGRLDEFLIFNRILTGTQIGALVTAQAPTFTSDTISKPNAAIGTAYEQTLSGNASDPNGAATLVFSKVGGPAWLTVAANGRLSGVPSAADAGLSRFIVRVTDSSGLADDAVLNINTPGPADLIAHHQFNNSPADSAGGTTATNFGSPVYADGLFERGIRLDGTDDYVRLRNTVVNGLTDITIAARVFWDGGNNWQRIFDFGNNTTQYMVLTPKSGANTLRFTITVTGNAAGSEQILEAPPLPVGEWSHVAVTLSGDIGTLYVNGAVADTRPILLNPADFSPSLNYIGKSQWPDPYFAGIVDDFRIYNRSLSGSEVRSLAIPLPAVVVPDPSFEAWAQAISFPEGENAADSDPDRDGAPNLLEYLQGSDPLAAGDGKLPGLIIKSGTELGGSTDPAKRYLTLSSRVKKFRPGVSLIPEGAETLADLASPAAASRMTQSGTPVSDGEYETITWFYNVAVEDGARGFVRLRVTK